LFWKPNTIFKIFICAASGSGGKKVIMSKSLFDLRGKVSVITGGSGGIGLGFARGIAKQGGDISIWARSEEKMAKAKTELEAYGVRVTTQAVDISSEQQVIAAYGKVLEDHGRLDCVIANAGQPPTSRSVLEMTTEQYHNLINTNMHGAFYTLREGARHMVNRAEAGEPGGALIFCGSLAIFHGIPGKENYAAAKAGVDAIIRCMAVEFAKYGIRANTIAPGYIKTEMTGPLDEMSPIDKYMIPKIPMGRPGYADDFEGIAAYLCSDASKFLSGNTIVIDGAELVS
jgi:NAD(P)-dependent dehydrogenase (short-subunit alcohol dehydrogenase family)